MEPDEVDRILRSLAATMEHQRSINHDLRSTIQELREFNREQRAINARLETLVTRITRDQHNGRDA
jgi:hypothetical protein